MRERPILLNADMVRAVLNGSKTQTRRIVTPQPELTERSGFAWKGSVFGAGSNDWETNRNFAHVKCPFGTVGDRLWVRETFAGHYIDDDQIQDIKDGRDKASDLCEYRADYPNGAQAVEGWTPSIHMPRWASRITLEITGVRVERLQDISEADAAAEGVPPVGDLLPDYSDTYLTPKGDFATAKVAFQRLWESIYKPESWQANPWVWVIEFRRVEGE